MDDKIKIVASFAMVALVVCAAGCVSQAPQNQSTTTTISESFVDDTDIIQDVNESWSSANDSVEIGEMV